MASKVNINSTKIFLSIYVLIHVIWLDGRADAVVRNLKLRMGGKSTGVSCGGAFDSTPGEFQHPVTSGNYYNSNEICTWTISSSHPLAFYFSRFNTEENHDHLSIRDGGSIGSSLIAKLTGKSLQYNFTTAGDAHIQFESDSDVVGTGFVLHWRAYSAEDQCKDKNGFCVVTGDRCDDSFEMIQNSCDDRCACCKPDTNNQDEAIGLCIGGVIIGNQCFKFSTEQLSWEDAKEKCLFQNGRLASLNDPEAFQDYARQNYGGDKFWLGGSDIESEGEFVWTNGQSLGPQFPWPLTQPDNADDVEDCLMWGLEGAFNDDPCDMPQKFVCEH